MKIKTPLEFMTFRDGVCDIYAVRENKLDVIKAANVNYGNRVIGVNRYYAARAATVKIHRLIQIPVQHTVTPQDNVVIGGERYEIEQLQELRDTCPPVMVLTLRKFGFKR